MAVDLQTVYTRTQDHNGVYLLPKIGAVILSALMETWRLEYPDPATATRDQVDAMVAATLYGLGGVDMVGMVQAFWRYPLPAGWLLCNGSTVPAADYPALAAVVGPGQLINGGADIQLPDLIDRFPLGGRTHADLGFKAGTMTTALTVDNMPAHSHTVAEAAAAWPDGPDVDPTGIAATVGAGVTGSTGSGSPFTNMPPFDTVIYGIWPG